MKEILETLNSLKVAHADALRFKAGERFHGDRWAAYGCQILRNRLRLLIERELRFE